MDHRPERLPPSAELGAELAFVRALARELVYDEHEAEDVAQDALVAGLSHAPRDTLSLRAWLARDATIALRVERPLALRVVDADGEPLACSCAPTPPRAERRRQGTYGIESAFEVL